MRPLAYFMPCNEFLSKQHDISVRTAGDYAWAARYFFLTGENKNSAGIHMKDVASLARLYLEEFVKTPKFRFAGLQTSTSPEVGDGKKRKFKSILVLQTCLCQRQNEDICLERFWDYLLKEDFADASAQTYAWAACSFFPGKAKDVSNKMKTVAASARPWFEKFTKKPEFQSLGRKSAPLKVKDVSSVSISSLLLVFKSSFAGNVPCQPSGAIPMTLIHLSKCSMLSVVPFCLQNKQTWLVFWYLLAVCKPLKCSLSVSLPLSLAISSLFSLSFSLLSSLFAHLSSLSLSLSPSLLLSLSLYLPLPSLFGLSWALLGLSWALWTSFWAPLEPSCRPPPPLSTSFSGLLGPSW